MNSKKILELFGWKIENEEMELPKKCVICLAPHTSNWDFLWGNLYNKAIDLRAKFFIKKEWIRFPLKKMMTALGAIPINRSKSSSVTDSIAEEFNSRDFFRVAISPEGTRKANGEWKKGFYYIALKANVPILLAYIDYAKKTVGCGMIVEPTGDYESDLEIIKSFYRGIKGKHPHKFSY